MSEPPRTDGPWHYLVDVLPDESNGAAEHASNEPITEEVAVVAALPPPDATAFEAPAAAPWPDLRGRTATIAIVTALALLLLIAAVSVQSAGTDPWCDDGRRGLFDAEDEFADRNAVDRNSAEDPGRC